MKKPKCIELAEKYCEESYGFNTHEYDAFIAGYEAAEKLILNLIKEDLKAVQDRRPTTPGLGVTEYILKSLIEQIEQL